MSYLLQLPIESETATQAIAFIDPAIDQYQFLASGVIPGIEAIVLNPDDDGVEQIIRTLATRPDITAAHIFAHGSPGHLFLGKAHLNSATLETYANSPHWSAALIEKDLFLHGCRVAEGPIGSAFLEKLHRLTGANIAASTTNLGATNLGGTWDLDVQLGEIERSAVLESNTMRDYDSILGTVTVTNLNDSGAGSLRDTIGAAQSGDTIRFASSLGGQTLTLTSGQLSIPDNKDLIVDGGDAAGLTISGSGSSRIFLLNSTSVSQTNLTIKNLTLANGYTPDQGGAITTTHQGVLTVENVTFTNNVADKGGGAIFSAFEGALTVLGSHFTNNRATAGDDERGAGAIAFFGPGALTVRDSEFTSNRGINGGAINSLNGQMTIENSRFVNNTVEDASVANGQGNPDLRGYGGAIYTDRANDSTIIRNSLFQGNVSRAAGGALYLFNDPEDQVTIENTGFTGNTAIGLQGGEGGAGGAIDHVRNSRGSGSFNLNNVSFVGNSSHTAGGAVWVNQTLANITNATFSGNTIYSTGDDYSANGGALGVFNNAEANIVNSTFVQNRAHWVGGAIVGDANAIKIKNSIFDRNTAANGTHNWNIQQHTSNTFVDQGGNIQFPPSDVNVTANARSVDPQLGALEQAGNLSYYPLLAGSPAINTGVAGAPSNDIRGGMRDAQPDIGAVEFGATTVLPPTLPPIGPPTLPSLSINDVQLNEGNSGVLNATFTVNLSAVSTNPVTVDYASRNGMAIAGEDYTAIGGTLSFAPGETSKTISVAIAGDTLAEFNETFFVNLNTPTNANILDNEGIGTIRNDDAVPVGTRPLCDFNGDGQVDLFWRHSTNASNTIWLLDNGSLTADPTTNGTGDPDWQVRGFADNDRDGGTDLTWENQRTGATVIWLMDGLQVRTVTDLGTSDPNWQIKAVVDYDGDGQNGDLVWRNTATGQNTVWLMDGTTFRQDLTLPALNSNWEIKSVADFNSDSQMDLVCRDPLTGESTIWLMNGAAVQGTISLGTIDDRLWDIKAAADFNGDGHTDVFWHNQTGQNSIWLLNGSEFEAFADVPTVSPTWNAEYVRDMNGDSRPDIVWQDQVSGANGLWFLNSISTPTGAPGALKVASSDWRYTELPAIRDTLWKAIG